MFTLAIVGTFRWDFFSFSASQNFLWPKLAKRWCIWQKMIRRVTISVGVFSSAPVIIVVSGMRYVSKIIFQTPVLNLHNIKRFLHPNFFFRINNKYSIFAGKLIQLHTGYTIQPNDKIRWVFGLSMYYTY